MKNISVCQFVDIFFISFCLIVHILDQLVSTLYLSVFSQRKLRRGTEHNKQIDSEKLIMFKNKNKIDEMEIH